MNRPKLEFGPYKTPRFRYGAIVECEVNGDMKIVGLSNGRIPWPLGRRVGTRSTSSLIIYHCLARAIRRESNLAVQYWFGMSPSVVSKCRRALGVVRFNEGTLRAAVVRGRSRRHLPALRAMWAKARDPVRCAKISAAKRGVPRPKHVIEAMVRGRRNKPVSAETRRKISEAAKRRGARPLNGTELWTAGEDRLVRQRLSSREVAALINRTPNAVRHRRIRLGVKMKG